MKYRNKKAQLEIMGLAVIVVLMVLGMLFLIRFVLFKSEDTYREDYIITQTAANMLNTILNTDTNCNDLSVTVLLQDASKYNPNINNCDSTYPDSKEFVNYTINYLMEVSIKQRWKKDYYFKASVPGDVIVEAGKEENYMERDRKMHFLPTDVGIMTIILDIYS